MLKSYIIWNSLDSIQQRQMLQRPIVTEIEIIKQKTKEIIETVKNKGDAALSQFTLKYDQVVLSHFKVSTNEINTAKQLIPKEHQQAIELAIRQIKRYHQAQIPQTIKINTCPGVTCERIPKPIQRVGLYIPGGSAPLVSTVMMLAIPAQLAGCLTRILVTPPNKDGMINPHILFAAELCGVSDIFKIGGAQAIAALAYGTETIPKVDKIFGPGNAWVTQAKLLVGQDNEGAHFDLPAGPSELLIIDDETSRPEFIAADLLSQAEHGVDSQVILITTSTQLALKVEQAIHQQLSHLPRKDIATKALTHSRFIVVDSIRQAITISNQYAPEHLILNVTNAEDWMPYIECAGAVFIGPWSPESLGDYVTGSNHVLPTYGYARSMSGLSTADFMTFINFQTISQDGIKQIGQASEILAEIEGLQAHKTAVSLRLKEINKLEAINEH